MLSELGHQVEVVPLSPDESITGRRELSDAGFVFNLFEGFAGRPETEAAVARALENTGLPFTGCPASSLALTLDKPATHLVLGYAGLATPRFQLLDPADTADFDLDFPCIVKPPADDASHALSPESVAAGREELAIALNRIAKRYPDSPALVEEFLNGREFNVTVLGNNSPRLLAVSEIIYTLPTGCPRLLTFAAKWSPDSAYYRHTAVRCPAVLDNSLAAELEHAALTAFRATGCRGYARMDFRLNAAGRPVILEVNANPDLSPEAGVARQAEAAGMTYRELIDAIVKLALEAT
jgi:D-alanine-D-alanine ligase